MKKIITLCYILLCSSLMAQNPVTFVTTLGGSANDYGNSIIQTPDSGYVVVGTSYTGSTSDLFLARLNKNGSLLWQKKYGGTSNEEGYAVALLPWGGMIISGYTTSYGAGGDVFLIKTEANGDTLWTRVYGTSGADYGKVIEVTPGGNYRITGVFMAGGTNKPGILNVDSNGVFISANFIYNQFASPNYHAHFLRDNIIGVTGASEMLMFTDTVGVYTGALNYANSGYSMDACYLPNGTYASVYQADYGGANVNTGLFLSDTLGTKLWNKKFSTTDDDIPMWVKPDGHGRILVAVMRRNPNTFNAKMVLMDIDYSGTVIWQNSYTYNGSSSYDQQIGDVIPTSDGGYAMIGSYTVNGSFTNYDFIIYKTDSVGNSGCKYVAATTTAATGADSPLSLTPQAFTTTLVNTGTMIHPPYATSSATTTIQCTNVTTGINSINASQNLNVWPNPANDFIHVDVPTGRELHYRIITVTGSLVMENRLMIDGIISISSLEKGIYFIQTYDGVQLKSNNKFIKN